MLSINPCNLCPRQCGVNRDKRTGFCGCGSGIKAARAALHFWEEPCISGTRGSGTVFFSGCTLQCVYCQNHSISREGYGKVIPVQHLAEIFLKLQEKGAHNINLVSPTPYLPQICRALESAMPALRIPVVFNCGGYERIDTIRELKGYADIYLTDIKYSSGEISQRYSGARDYFYVASQAVREMIVQTGALEYDGEGMMQKGVIIRHLVLPGARRDSMEILRWIAENLPKDKYVLSLMSQYTPTDFVKGFPEINRRVTAMEYDSVVAEAVRLGLSSGFMQRRSSADKAYIPPFDLEGI